MKNLTATDFEPTIIDSAIMLVDFWAPWCGPCKKMAPFMDEIANEWKGKIKVGKVNIEDNSELTQKYRIWSVPTVFLFKNGKPVWRLAGFRSKEKIISEIKKYIG